ncbi:MAG: cell division protein FtsQ/DivIB [Gammaproteobacteria bacterium]
MARNRKRKNEPAKRWSISLDRLRVPLSALAVVGTGAVVLWGAVAALDRPISAITISGEFERVSPVAIEAAMGDLQGQGFLSADLDKLQRRVEKLAWVEEARIHRRWPAELVLTITEQAPAARWREAGLLNTRGELFIESARHIPAELPNLYGPSGAEAMVARRYLDIRGPLAEAGYMLNGVRLDDRGAWRISLGGGLEVRFGREDFDARFDRFIRLATPLLASRDGRARYVDLRYPRGFTVAWAGDAGDSNTAQKGSDKDV